VAADFAMLAAADSHAIAADVAYAAIFL